MRIWLAIAEIHMNQGDLEAADACALEARSLTPHAYQVTVTRALILEASGNYDGSRQLFEDALAVNPFNADNTFHLARVCFQLSHYRLAWTCMTNAIRIDPYNEHYWSFFGQIFDKSPN